MKKLVVYVIAASLILLYMRPVFALAEDAPVSLSLDEVSQHSGYVDYLNKYKDVDFLDNEQYILAEEYTEAKGTVSKESSLPGYEGISVVGQEDSTITWTITVPEAGFYQIYVEYYPVKGKGGDIERKVLINGEVPFKGTDVVLFSRIWTLANDITSDANGNEIRPKQVEMPQWTGTYIKDSSGNFNDPYQFYFQEGKNTFSLEAVREPLAIKGILFTRIKELPSYNEVKEEYAEKGYQSVDDSITVTIQGERTYQTSSSTLYPINDRSSALTQSSDGTCAADDFKKVSKTRLNMVGGENWKSAGQWISWEVQVPESGLYTINIKYRQKLINGVSVNRSIKVDGEYPFKEAKEIAFHNKNTWQNKIIGDDQPYLFYLEKGQHTLTLEVTLTEDLGEILDLIEDCVYELNKTYRQMLVIIGTTPDTKRDYSLEKKVPEAIKILEEQYKALSVVQEKIKECFQGSKGMNSSALEQLIYQTELMYKNPDKIARNWNTFKDNIVSLSSWALSIKEQPLEIDYINIASKDADLPKVEASFWQKLIFEIRNFFASFTEDYDSIGNVYGTEALTVWVLSDSSGRDQAQILKQMVDESFTPEKSIPINIKIVNGGVMLSAVLAGKGPDVALHMGNSDPVNYALRNAVVDLTQFADYNEVLENFYNASMTPYEYDGGVYALPETMDFMVMFYRADILSDLGIAIPQNWDEFHVATSVIQKNNMQVGLPIGAAANLLASYTMFLEQNNCSLYTKDGMSTNLTSEEAIEAFQTWTAMFTDYTLPVSYDLANRFRTGEMPLAISNYTAYNYLSIFAPEIKGLWGITMVPGTLQKDESLDRTSVISGTSCVILDDSDMKDNAWEFLKWWTSAETQQEYGNSVENLLGVSGRLATASKVAIELLPWSERDLKVLKSQLEYVKGIPEIPGGYMTSRHIQNAFYSVYNNNENPREVLEEYALNINNEITNKRIEFNLPVK
ncbi:ABC-type glycerol-3-phosphate transport system substrate-binding protein [Anaerotaenia torta]|uniref:extracellular solute-binding protein n=1 Tax=Anaerotaenia torta TaxID=433293 RepID=UPI003D23FF59